jgi:hypothetical protein
MKKKYIITSNGFPVLFDEGLIHRAVSVSYSVHSAGFCNVWYDPELKRIRVKCWGESSSLHVRSIPESDACIIENMLND